MAEPTFPFDAESDLEVALVHGALLLVGVLVAKQLEQIAASLLEQAAPAAPRDKLVIGKLPLPADHDRVALVRGGVPALAELVRERAFAEGWLTRDDEGLAVGAAVPGEAALSTALRAALPFARAREADLERASRSVAARTLDQNAGALESRGLVPSTTQRVAALTAYALPAVGVVGLGVSRVLRATSLHAGVALAVAQLVLSIIVFVAAARPRRRTNAGERYVLWLQEATQALLEDVSNGGLGRREDFLLLVAAHGAHALGTSGHARTAMRLSTTSEQSEGGGGTG